MVVAEDGFGVRGGVRASDDTREIAPSCCCGLGKWRQWLDGLTSGEPPWLGHEPSAYVEYGPEVVLVWSDGGLAAPPGAAETAFAIEFARGHFERELARVGADLLAFLGRLESWARSVGFSDPAALVRAFDRDFHIRAAPAARP